MVNKVEYIVSN